MNFSDQFSMGDSWETVAIVHVVVHLMSHTNLFVVVMVTHISHLAMLVAKIGPTQMVRW